MRKLFNSIFTLAVLALIMSACSKTDDPVENILDPTPSTGTHAELWHYDSGFGSINDIIPAIDENDNIYFSLDNIEAGNVGSICLDKNGNEKWKIFVPGYISGKTIYYNNKVFVSTYSPISIYCLNATSGDIEWQKNLTDELSFELDPTIALGNDRLYVNSGTFLGTHMLAYDMNGNLIWDKPSDDQYAMNMSIVGSSVYFYTMDYLFRYDDNGTSCDFVWSWEHPSTSGDGRNLLAFKDLPIGEDGNIYIIDEDIFIISPDGQLLKTIELGVDITNDFASNMTLTAGNDIIIGNGNLLNIGNNGNIQWETDITGTYINPTFTNAATIADNGNLYDGQLFGLYSVKSSGSLDWRVTAENGGGTEYGNLHPPVLNHEGNIIIVASEASEVRCFKGDGSQLASQGWPKPFGDYGNTCSK
jgi:outer membrane protein assembly factor BamB